MGIVAKQFIEFFERALENRAETVEAGAPKYTDVHFVRIYNPGGKDVFEKEVDNYLRESRDPEMRDKVQRSYNDWKGKRDPEVSGIRLKDIPLLSLAEQKILADLKVFTVEDLASIDENGIRAIGMGGRALKKKAEDYLKAANDVGKAVQQINSMRAEREGDQARIKELEDAIRDLKADKTDAANKKKNKEAA